MNDTLANETATNETAVDETLKGIGSENYFEGLEDQDTSLKVPSII